MKEVIFGAVLEVGVEILLALDGLVDTVLGDGWWKSWSGLLIVRLVCLWVGGEP